jgi:hypothetical protein
MAGSTQFDVAYFPLQAGHHDTAANDLAAKLQQAADGDWRVTWMLTTGEGIVMVLQRPTPVAPPPRGSLGGYGDTGR